MLVQGLCQSVMPCQFGLKVLIYLISPFPLKTSKLCMSRLRSLEAGADIHVTMLPGDERRRGGVAFGYIYLGRRGRYLFSEVLWSEYPGTLFDVRHAPFGRIKPLGVGRHQSRVRTDVHGGLAPHTVAFSFQRGFGLCQSRTWWPSHKRSTSPAEGRGEVQLGQEGSFR